MPPDRDQEFADFMRTLASTGRMPKSIGRTLNALSLDLNDLLESGIDLHKQYALPAEGSPTSLPELFQTHEKIKPAIIALTKGVKPDENVSALISQYQAHAKNARHVLRRAAEENPQNEMAQAAAETARNLAIVSDTLPILYERFLSGVPLSSPRRRGR